MLDRLPTELLQHVLRLAYPPRYDWRVYKKRRRDLGNLSLVSKRVKEVAQPMLPEVYAVGAGTAVHPRKEDHPRMSEIRSLSIDMPPESLLSTPTFEVDAWPRLTELRLENCRVDWGGLANCPQLRRLHLSECRTSGAAHPPLFPLLNELSAEGVTFDRPDVGHFLSPSTFPSLELLAVNDVTSLDNPDSPLLPDPATWGSQLSVLYLLSYEADRASPEVLYLPHILIHWWVEDSEDIPFLFLPFNLRLSPDEDLFSSDWIDPVVPLALSTLAGRLESQHLESPRSSLKVLVLPGLLQACSGDEAAETALGLLLRRCVESDVTVLWDDGGEEASEDWWDIPQCFLDFRRRKMREEADREAANEAANKEVNEAANEAA